MRDVDGKAWIVSARTSIGHACLDGQDAFVDGGRRVGHGHRRTDQLARGPIEDQGHVAEVRLDRVALDRGREVRHQLEGIEPGRLGSVEGQADRGQLGLDVGRPRQGAVVGRDGFAARHPDRQLALVVALVRVQLRSRWVADEPQSVADPQASVTRQLARRQADRLEAEAVERKGPSDRQQRDVTCGRRAIVQLDDVGALGACTGTRSQRPDPQANGHAVALQGSERRVRVPWVVGRAKAARRTGRW